LYVDADGPSSACCPQMLCITRGCADAGFELHARLRCEPSQPLLPQKHPRPPLVIALGFLGAKPSVMRSIVRRYENLGYDTAWTIPPTTTTFSLTDSPKRAFAAALISAIADLGHGGIILAPFSNAGGYIIRFLHCALSDADGQDDISRSLYTRIVGVVYDSSPCVALGPVIGARALAEGQKSSLFLFPRSLLRSTLVVASNVLRTTGSPDGNFVRDLNDCIFPNAGELFCFSEIDPLCSAGGVDTFITIRLDKVRVCLRQCFKNSRHVSHLRENQDTYMSRVRELHMRAVDPWRRSIGLPDWPLTVQRAAL
jgi:Eukaryotic protein of unknown function (DUF829)